MFSPSVFTPTPRQSRLLERLFVKPLEMLQYLSDVLRGAVSGWINRCFYPTETRGPAAFFDKPNLRPLFFALLATDFPAFNPSTLPTSRPPLPAGHQSISAPPGRHVCGEGLI